MTTSAASAREEAEALNQEADATEGATVKIQAGITGHNTRTDTKPKLEAQNRENSLRVIQGGLRGRKARKSVADQLANTKWNEDGTEDNDYIKPDLEITLESYKQTRTAIKQSIDDYLRTGRMRMRKEPGQTESGRIFRKPKTEEELKAQAFDRSQNMARKREERRRAVTIESDAKAKKSAADGDAARRAAVPDDFDSDGDELTEEEKKAREFERIKKKKEQAARRRSRSRSESMGQDSPQALDDDIDFDNAEFDDEELLSPNTRARKPAAMPGCVVHSIQGKFVQVPMFGTTSSVPVNHKRDKLV